MYILSFDIKEQLKMMLENVNEVNRERTRIVATSCVHDSTRQNGLITICFIYSGDLNTGLVWYLNGRKLSDG